MKKSVVKITDVLEFYCKVPIDGEKSNSRVQGCQTKAFFLNYFTRTEAVLPHDLEMFAAPFENDVNCTVFVCATPEFPNLITKTEDIRVMLLVNEDHGDISIPPSIMENYTFFHTGNHLVLNIIGGGAILKMK